MSRERKPKTLPYVYLDIDAEADGKEFKNREVRIGANCSVFDSTWPTKCPFYRGHMDPPQEGDECVYGRSGECACREIRIEAVRRFKEFVDEFLAEVEEVDE